MSLPTRERELKQLIDAPMNPANRSLPTRERELKPATSARARAVAPHAGARIETQENYRRIKQLLTSLPMRERELKLRATRRRVAGRRSLPMRERELKRAYNRAANLPAESLPMRERELKPEAVHRPRVGVCRSPCGSAN